LPTLTISSAAYWLFATACIEPVIEKVPSPFDEP
jgi:hypothetical protein